MHRSCIYLLAVVVAVLQCGGQLLRQDLVKQRAYGSPRRGFSRECVGGFLQELKAPVRQGTSLQILSKNTSISSAHHRPIVSNFI
jgi:hypothetical protein